MIVMVRPKQTDDPSSEIRNLLKKSLILQLFQLGVSQGDISKKLRVDVHAVNEFLRGIKKRSG